MLKGELQLDAAGMKLPSGAPDEPGSGASGCSRVDGPPAPDAGWLKHNLREATGVLRTTHRGDFVKQEAQLVNMYNYMLRYT